MFLKRWVLSRKVVSSLFIDRVPCSKSCQKPKALKRQQSIIDHKGKQIPWKQQSLGQRIRFTLASLHIGYASSFLGRPEFYIQPYIWASLSPHKSNLSVRTPNTHIFCSLHKFHTSHFRCSFIHYFYSTPHKSLHFCLVIRPILRRI